MAVPLPARKFRISAPEFEEKIEQLRINKEVELKLKLIEEEKMKKFREEMAKNKGSYDITKLIEDAKKDDGEVDLFERLRQRGKSITFDYNGLPIV